MSRGLGEIQNAILQRFEDCSAENTAESLRWSLFDGSLSSNLTTSWNTSFRRALHRLYETAEVTITKRRLQSFEECAMHYPNKTLRADTRSLRATLLPTLSDWLFSREGPAPRYKEEENERFHLEQLPESEFATLRARWSSLYERLRPLYGQVPELAADVLLALICRGRSLFQNHPSGLRLSEIVVGDSFALCVELAGKSNALPKTLFADLRDFKDLFQTAGEARSLRFKSIIHAVATVEQKNKGCRLKTEPLEHLHAMHRDLVESMPGFVKKGADAFTVPWERCHYDNRLVSLFDHTVFSRFSFVRLPLQNAKTDRRNVPSSLCNRRTSTFNLWTEPVRTPCPERANAPLASAKIRVSLSPPH